MTPQSTLDPAHVIYRYDTGLRAKFRRHTLWRFAGDRKHKLTTTLNINL